MLYVCEDLPYWMMSNCVLQVRGPFNVLSEGRRFDSMKCSVMPSLTGNAREVRIWLLPFSWVSASCHVPTNAVPLVSGAVRCKLSRAGPDYWLAVSVRLPIAYVEFSSVLRSFIGSLSLSLFRSLSSLSTPLSLSFALFPPLSLSLILSLSLSLPLMPCLLLPPFALRLSCLSFARSSRCLAARFGWPCYVCVCLLWLFPK